MIILVDMNISPKIIDLLDKEGFESKHWSTDRIVLVYLERQLELIVG
ncbi:MAG: hypothetical protein FWD38_12115 [Oscillospiraceae bacterium]|nr:hypothetical protein [Oscillospiraceae bacterium]